MKPDTVSTVYPSICHEVMEPDAMMLVFRMLSFMLSEKKPVTKDYTLYYCFYMKYL